MLLSNSVETIDRSLVVWRPLMICNGPLGSNFHLQGMSICLQFVKSSRSQSISECSLNVELDKGRLAEVWRRAAYALGNCLLANQLMQMKLYDLKPVDLLVFNLVAVASVQRSARSIRQVDDSSQDFSPSDEGNGAISRRRIAECSGLARTSVSRSLSRLIERGMVIERGRGRLQVPVGIIMRGNYEIDPNDLYGPVAGLFEQLLRLGVMRFTERGASQDSATPTISSSLRLSSQNSG